MKKRVMLYINHPKGSEKMIIKQLNQLTSFVVRKDYIIVGALADSNPRPWAFYNETSKTILEAAANDKFDILLMTDIKQIIPKRGRWVHWGELMKFNDSLKEYGVQIFDLVIQDQQLEYEQFLGRCVDYRLFSIKEDESSENPQICLSGHPHVDMNGFYRNIRLIKYGEFKNDGTKTVLDHFDDSMKSSE